MLPVGPLRFSTQPGRGSRQAAVTMLGRTMEMGRQPPSQSRATSPRAWPGDQGSVKSFLVIFHFSYLGGGVGVWLFPNDFFCHLIAIEYFWLNSLEYYRVITLVTSVAVITEHKSRRALGSIGCSWISWEILYLSVLQ